MPVRIGSFVYVIGVVGSALCVSSVSGQTLAFPEAEGFGRFAQGPRANLSSATVYHVTNLNDSGPGSFRDAVSQSNRYVVFDVGGIANISSVVTVASNVYIAGQTAPGGFALYGNRVAFHGANNLISRHFAIRNAASNNNDAASLARGQNMIWDRMSITWGVDGTFDINPDSGQIIDNLTIQDSIISQGLQVRNHSTGGLMTLEENRNLSVIRSLFAQNKTRNPKARGNTEFINNVVYGWNTAGYIMGDTVNAIGRANAEGNYFIRGPVNSSTPFTSGTAQYQIYGNGNLYDSNQNGVLDGTPVTSYPGATVMAARHNFPTTSVMSAQAALAFVLDNVGPNITRDTVDDNIVNNVRSYGTLGGLIDRETDVFPNYGTDPQYLNPRARLIDTDNDGIPDNWETSRGLNPSNGSDWKNLVGGYTQLEHYLNELGGYGTTRNSAGGAWTTAATWGGTVPNFADTAIVTGSMTHAAGQGFARRLTLDGTSSISGGTIDVFDTVLIGAGANGALGISGGTVSTGRVVLASTGRTGSMSINTGGTLQTGQIIAGGGAGSLAFNGGTFRAIAAINIAVPTNVGVAGGTINTNGFDGSITGGLSGSGNLTKQGNGTLTLGGNNANFSGQISLNAGQITLATNAANSSIGVITLGNGTTLNVSTSGASTPIALAGISSATISAGGLTYNGAITGPAGTTLNIANSSTGTSNFSVGGNMSAFAGNINLTSTGNIRIGSAGSALAHFNLGSSTGTIRTTFDGTVNFGSIAGGTSTRLQGSTNGTTGSTYVIGANGNSTTFNGTITDGTNTTPAPLSITKAGNGTLTLTGTNVYTGMTTISAGTLRVNGSHTTGSSYSVLSNGTLGGTGTIGGAVDVAGRIAPGVGIGSLTLTGPISFNGGKVAIEIASASSFDVLIVNAPKNLDTGEIEITLLNGFSPLGSSSFTVIGGSGAISGTLGGLNAWGLITVAGGSGAFTPTVGATSVTLTDFVRVGDVNRDGAVNNLDISSFVALLTGAAASGAVGFAGDVNGDGVVNNLDIAPFVALLTGGRPVGDDPELAPLMSLVPEPASLSLLGFAGLMLKRTRR